MIGAQGGSYLEAGRWQISTGFRYYRSDRHFVGKEEQVHRETEQSEVINWIRMVDVSATYAFSNRLNLTLAAPFFFNDRSNPIRAADRTVVDRALTSANGIGDVSVTARTWILNPEDHADHNIGIGLGLKLPTGNSGVTDTFKTLTGQEVRTVDQSILPGDGGVGIVFDTQMYKRIWKATVSVNGVYLFNPRNTTDVRTFRSRPSEAFMSVADQYLFRVGAGFPLPKKGIAASIAGRIEGVPAKDLMGKSDGFRRPGYAVSVEPGFSLVRGSHAFGLSLPIAVSRNRTRSVSDILAGRHGDAAFADYSVMLGYTMRF